MCSPNYRDCVTGAITTWNAEKVARARESPAIKKKFPWYYETCLCFGRGKNNASYDERWERAVVSTQIQRHRKRRWIEHWPAESARNGSSPFTFFFAFYIRHILPNIIPKHHTRLNRIARASSWPGANVILAGYSSSKSALMLDANHAEISPAVHRYVCMYIILI